MGVAQGFDLETGCDLTLEEVATGCEKTVEFTRVDVCEPCSGSGAKAGSKPVVCPTCGGHGKVQQTGLGGMFRMVIACPACAGRGQVIKDFCPDCRGKGRVGKKRTLSVKFPPGISDGQAVRIKGEGEPPQQQDSPSGDGIRGSLHVVVHVREHELFQRDGNDLLLELPISITQATLGAEIPVPTIDDERTPLTIPRATQHGDIFRVDDKGLPDLSTGRRGDLVIAVRVEVPRSLTKDQERLLREFAATTDEQVLPESSGLWGKVFGKSKGKK